MGIHFSADTHECVRCVGADARGWEYWERGVQSAGYVEGVDG